MSSPTKSCTLDPIPTDLLKELIDILLPYLTVMVNPPDSTVLTTIFSSIDFDSPLAFAVWH